MRFWTLFLLFGGLVSTAPAQWSVQESHTAANLRGIHALSDRVAWASGSEGTVLHTTDGGASWQRCAMPDDAQQLDFRGVQGFDPSTAVVMSSGRGELSRVYKTTDGCRTWSLVLKNPDPEGTWDSMQFQYHPAKAAEPAYFSYGVLIGHPVAGEFVIFTSKDHGSTWQALREDEAFAPGPPALAKPGEVPFSLSNTALTALADQDSFAFVTGGEGGGRLLYPQGERYDFNFTAMKYTFAELQLPLPAGAGAGAFSVAARRSTPDRVDLMVVGGDSTRPEVGSAVFVRHGGVASLKKLMAPRAIAAARPPGGFRSAVAYDGRTDSWITVGPNGTDVSRDDGRTWTPLYAGSPGEDGSSRNWQALSLPFAVGPDGRIGKLEGLRSQASGEVAHGR